jgi:hypothetical protein
MLAALAWRARLLHHGFGKHATPYNAIVARARAKVAFIPDRI